MRGLTVASMLLCLASASSAMPITVIVTLSPDLESPAVISEAAGTATLRFDPDVMSDGLDYVIELDSMGTVGAARIYAGLPGTNGPLLMELFDFTGFGIPGNPLSVSGTVLLDTATLSAVMSSGAYVNIDSEAFPDGEIRGDIVPVPEPGSVALLGLGFAALAARRRAKV